MFLEYLNNRYDDIQSTMENESNKSHQFFEVPVQQWINHNLENQGHQERMNTWIV